MATNPESINYIAATTDVPETHTEELASQIMTALKAADLDEIHRLMMIDFNAFLTCLRTLSTDEQTKIIPDIIARSKLGSTLGQKKTARPGFEE